MFHGRPVLLGHVFCETLKKCRKWHISLNFATRGCPLVKFKFGHASTLGEGHLGQRWRICYPMGTHNNFFRHWNQVVTINWHLDLTENNSKEIFWSNKKLTFVRNCTAAIKSCMSDERAEVVLSKDFTRLELLQISACPVFTVHLPEADCTIFNAMVDGCFVSWCHH